MQKYSHSSRRFAFSGAVPLVAASAMALVTASAGAAVITGATFTGSTGTDPVTDPGTGVVITSFTIGSTTYSGLVNANAVDFDANTAGVQPIASDRFYRGTGTLPIAAATTDTLAVTDPLRVDTGVLNVAARNTPPVNFFFATPITAATGFFLTDININNSDTDDFIVTPIDVTGAAVGAGVLVTLAGTAPTLTTLASITLEDGVVLTTPRSINVKGAALFASDFGTLTGTINGVRISENGSATSDLGVDVGAIGTFIVPEPASLALMGLGTLCMFTRRSRA